MTILWEFCGSFDENIQNKLALKGLRPGLLSAVPSGLCRGCWDVICAPTGLRTLPGVYLSFLNKRRVPHVSLVFRETWDTTVVDR